jgi:Ca2+:H+ antiporter
MTRILREMRKNPIFWLLILAPVVLVAEHLAPKAHTLLFFLSVAAIVPLAALLSHSTEAVASKTGDAIGGLLNATLGNLTELVIAITALRAGMFELVKASIAGAIVANTLFMLGAALLLGGLRHRVQEYNPLGARLQVNMLMLATVTLIVPSASSGSASMRRNCVGPERGCRSMIVSYALAPFSWSRTASFRSKARPRRGRSLAARRGNRRLGGSHAVHRPGERGVCRIGAAAALALGMSPAFVGSSSWRWSAARPRHDGDRGARKNSLDLSVGIALGSASQIALFIAPVLVLLSHAVAPAPMDLSFTPGQVLAVFVSMLTAALVAMTGRSAWFSGVQLLAVYGVFAVTLYLMPK